MPKRTDIKKIMIIGSGPIIISQACEFDYSGTQACKALKEEGFEVVLVNSNPATIMTDPETVASFEPTIDYCVVKFPRWTFEKFPDTEDFLTTSMKSVGETMAIGRTFKEALQKGLRSLEIGRFGLGADGRGRFEQEGVPLNLGEIRQKLITPNSQRIFYLRDALRAGMDIAVIHSLTGIDPWFLHQMDQIIRLEEKIRTAEHPLPTALFRQARENGFSDAQLVHLLKVSDDDIRETRKRLGIEPVYKLVDTCAAEFEAYTPYYTSTYEKENEIRLSDRTKVMILGRRSQSNWPGNRV